MPNGGQFGKILAESCYVAVRMYTITKSHLETRCEAAVATQVASHSCGRGRAFSDLSRADLGGLGAAHEDGPTDGTIEREEETTGSPVVFTGGESRPVKGKTSTIKIPWEKRENTSNTICHPPEINV